MSGLAGMFIWALVSGAWMAFLFTAALRAEGRSRRTGNLVVLVSFALVMGFCVGRLS